MKPPSPSSLPLPPSSFFAPPNLKIILDMDKVTDVLEENKNAEAEPLLPFVAIFPLFGIQMYHNLGDQWATSVLAFLTLVMTPFPYLFFTYGKRIRGHSRFATA